MSIRPKYGKRSVLQVLSDGMSQHPPTGKSCCEEAALNAAEVVRLHDQFAALADGLEAEAENLCEWGSVQEGAKGSGLAEAAARIREVIERGKA